MNDRAVLGFALGAFLASIADPMPVYAQTGASSLVPRVALMAAADPAEAPSEPPPTPDADREAASTRASRHEEEGVSYRSVGIAFRESFAPPVLLEVALQNAPRGIRVPQVSLEFGRRRDGFQVTGTLTYSDFGFHGAFRSNGDPVTEYEWLDSNLKSVGLGAGVSWSSHFSDVFAIEGGMDFGLGALFGNVRRTEAYPSHGNNPNGARGWAPCSTPTVMGGTGSDSPAGDFAGPGGVGSYCGAPASGFTDPDTRNGQQYHVNYHNWFNGGGLPAISWRLAPRLSFRIKPIAQLVFRIDVGIDFGSGIFLGGAMHYVLGQHGSDARN